MATFWEKAARSVSNLYSLYFVYILYLFISRFSFKSGICLLIAQCSCHCFSITFIRRMNLFDICVQIESCTFTYPRQVTVYELDIFCLSSSVRDVNAQCAVVTCCFIYLIAKCLESFNCDSDKNEKKSRNDTKRKKKLAQAVIEGKKCQQVLVTPSLVTRFCPNSRYNYCK